MPQQFYSGAAARKSLLHFVGGKLIAAALSVSYLLITVRAMEPVQYGRYVALLAICDVFYVTTGLGLSTIAQRYLAEYRISAIALDFNAFLRGTLRRRLVQSILFALVLVALWRPLMAVTGLSLTIDWVPVIFVLLVASAGVSYLEEVMSALLLQGYSQALGIARNLIKLLFVTVIIVTSTLLPLRSLMYIEGSVALMSWLCAEYLVRRWSRLAPSAVQAKEGFASQSMARVSLRFYAVQLIWAGYSPSMVKLIVTRVLGVAQTAALGVAQSMTDLLRNYMPAHLLSGWVRPIMVARYVASRDVRELSLVTNLILKVNLFGLVLAAAVFIVMGDQLMAWVTKGRYVDLGLLLALFTGVVMLQSAHVLLSMVILTLEQAGVSLRATLAAAATLPILVLALLVIGLNGAAIGLAIGEAVWIGVAWLLLRRRRYMLSFDVWGVLKIGIAGLAATAVGNLCTDTQVNFSWWGASLAMALTYGIVVLVLRPASASEIVLVRRLFAARESRA